jgi:hypothetical protein
MAGQRPSGSHRLTAKLSLSCLRYWVFAIDSVGKQGCFRKPIDTVAMN